MNLLFLTKDKPFSKEAAELTKRHFPKTTVICGDARQPIKQDIYDSTYDYIISYIFPWIVPERALKKVKIAAINLHPGPPEYPGIGCTNFAVYNNESEFGITVHHMKSRVDSGRIIAVERFPVFGADTLYSLTQRCYAFIYVAFVKILDGILKGEPLPESSEVWKREPYTRKELNELCIITQDMDEREISRRIKATTYPGMPGAYIEMAGKQFRVASDGEHSV
jgi:methionyl-tRNA formyltransferase